jgi:predicted nicotinamide N-methyase
MERNVEVVSTQFECEINEELKYFPIPLLERNSKFTVDNIHVANKRSVVGLCSLANKQHFKEHCFTGLHINPAAQVMARFIIAHWDFIRTSKIVELGCGIGLTGLVAAEMSRVLGNGVERFVLTDGEEKTVELGRANLSRQADANISFEQMFWEKKAVEDLLRAESSEGFDIVLGADLIYSRVDLAALIKTSKALLGETRVSRNKIIVFIFLPRVAEFPEQIREACSRGGLSVHYGRIESFLTEKIVMERYWHNIEFCIMHPEDSEIPEELKSKWEIQELSVRECQELEDERLASEDVLLETWGSMEV